MKSTEETEHVTFVYVPKWHWIRIDRIVEMHEWKISLKAEEKKKTRKQRRQQQQKKQEKTHIPKSQCTIGE